MNSEKHQCVTMAEMEAWWRNENKEALAQAVEKANNCPLCKRIWMKFWASKPAS